MPLTGSRFLSPEESRNAIWVDFEGNMDRDPTLLGVLVDGDISLWIVEEPFTTCARSRRAKATFKDLAALARGLVERSASEDRLIVARSN